MGMLVVVGSGVGGGRALSALSSFVASLRSVCLDRAASCGQGAPSPFWHRWRAW